MREVSPPVKSWKRIFVLLAQAPPELHWLKRFRERNAGLCWQKAVGSNFAQRRKRSMTVSQSDSVIGLMNRDNAILAAQETRGQETAGRWTRVILRPAVGCRTAGGHLPVPRLLMRPALWCC